MRQWLSVAGLLVAWELTARWEWISRWVLVPPSAVARAGRDLIASGLLAEDLGATLGRLAIALLIGGAAGLVIGLAAGVFRPLRELLEPLLNGLNTLPKVTLLPLAMVSLGIGEASRNVPGILTCLALMALHSIDAVRGVNPALVELGRNYGARGWSLFRTVYLPSCLPQLATGLRMSLSLSLVVIVSCEMLGTRRGLGNLIWSAGQSFATERLYVGLVVCASLGWAIVYGLTLLERKLAPWAAPPR